jgi:hypothetical protein
VNYHCPYCSRKKEVKAQCRLEEELKAKKEAELRAKEKMEKEKEDRGKADNVAGAAYEFWTLMGEVMEELQIQDQVEAGMVAELPAPSPDSITVTTEFGVLEETGNITTITAGPAPVVIQTEDIDQDGQEEVDEHVEVPQNTTAPPIALHLAIELQAEEMADDEASGIDPDLEESEDFDAEGALIDEFIEEVGLTGTLVS